MANGHGFETPETKIATAQAILTMALRIHAEVMAGRIGRDIFDREVPVYTGAAGLIIPAFPDATLEDLQSGTFNLVQIALGASALTVDEVLKDVYGSVAEDADPTRTSLRVMVNQLRNAFAHNMWRPRWQIWERYRKTYPIVLGDGSSFTFDATNLDGAGLLPAQVGGLEFWNDVLRHCESLVRVSK